MRNVTFDFFLVRPASPSDDFRATLESLRQREQNRRCLRLEDKTCLMLNDYIAVRNAHAYLFSRLRLDAIPPVRGVSGVVKRIILDDDEGLGEDVAIAFDPINSVVCVQRNRFALSYSSIFYTINSLSGKMFMFEPILDRGALEKFAEYGVFKKARVKFAGVDNLDFLQDKKVSSLKKVAITELLESPYVDITFSVGNRKASLPDWIRNLVEGCATSSGPDDEGYIAALEVTGAMEHGAVSQTIDMLGQRLVYTRAVRMVNRMVDTNHLMRIACAAIVKYRMMVKK